MLIKILIITVIIAIEVASCIKLSKCGMKKKVKPELVAVLRIKGEEYPDYRCECGYGLAEDYIYCPYCGTELNWNNVHKWDEEESGLTPKEVLEAKEVRTPDYEGDGCDEDGNIIYDTWICPKCRTKYEVDYEKHKFCPECGQAIRWEG